MTYLNIQPLPIGVSLNSPAPTLFQRLKLRDWLTVLLIALAGSLLGLAINAASPRGFNMSMAAASSSETAP